MLVVTDNQGATASDTATVTVTNSPGNEPRPNASSGP
jgi:hypothetical protein